MVNVITSSLSKVITLSGFYCPSEKGKSKQVYFPLKMPLLDVSFPLKITSHLKKTFYSYTFHIMRDHPQHTTDILGGMFGIDQRSLDSKRERLREFNDMIAKYGNKWQKGNDQVSITPNNFCPQYQKTM